MNRRELWTQKLPEDVYKRQTTLTMKHKGEIWIWAVASLKRAEVCARYHINAGRSATSIVAIDSVFLFKGQSENGCPFLFEELTKGAERI